MGRKTPSVEPVRGTDGLRVGFGGRRGRLGRLGPKGGKGWLLLRAGKKEGACCHAKKKGPFFKSKQKSEFEKEGEEVV